MVQSRAQFGMFGAALPILAVVLLYIGFFAASLSASQTATHVLQS